MSTSTSGHHLEHYVQLHVAHRVAQCGLVTYH